MRQFSVCMLKPARPGDRRRLVIVVQHDVLSDLRTREVAPLLNDEEVSFGRLTPFVMAGGKRYAIGLHQLITVDRSSLEEPVDHVEAGDGVMRGMDLLLMGF